MQEVWRERLVTDPEILGGKPVIAGTCVGVARVLELF